MRDVMETAGFAVVIVQGEVICHINPAAAMSGYTSEELIGMPFGNIVHPDYRDEVRAAVSLFQSGEIAPERREIKIICKDGCEVWLLAIASATEFNGKPAALSVLLEMPAWEERHIRMEAIFNAIPDAIVTVDRDMRILQYNEPFKAHCGMTAAITSLRLCDIPISCSRGCHDAIRDSLVGGRAVREYRVVCKRVDRPEQVTAVNCSPLNDRFSACSNSSKAP